jgi:hypothetical protein
VGVSLVVVVRVRECSSFSSSSCSTSILADLIVFVQAIVGSGCELYLAVMMMVNRVKDTDGTIPANSNERFFVPCGQYIKKAMSCTIDNSASAVAVGSQYFRKPCI